MGNPEFAVPTLKSLNKSEHKILSVYTQPPKKKFRGQKFKESQYMLYQKIKLPSEISQKSLK